MNKLTIALIATFSFGSVARAGIDGSTGKIESAITSGSVDAILAELERAEYIPTSGAIKSVIALIDHPSERVREAAGWWLDRRSARATVISMAQTRLAGQDPVAALNVLDAIRGLRDASTLSMIGAYVAHPLDEASGIAALRALGATASPNALSYVMPALSSQLAGVRAQGLRAVRELRAPVGSKVITNGSAFIGSLNDGDEGVRREACITLGYLAQGGQNPDAASAGVSALSTTLANDTSVRVRRAAAWALGEIGNAAGRSALQAALNDSDASVRSVAAAATARLN